MFTVKFKTDPTKLQQEIDKLEASLTEIDGDDPKYSTIVDQLTKLYKLQKEIHSYKRVSPEKLAEIGGGLAGILMIIVYEQKHVITSKALAFVSKLR